MQVRSGVAGLGSTRGEEAAAAAVRLEESRQDFDGAPVETPDGCVASEVCFARAVREPARGRHLSVTTSHGPPGSCSPLEDVLMLTELREAVLQWLPCCDLCRARRVSRRFFAWADSALAAQRSPAVICNTKRDYSGLNLVQQLDPRQCAFTPVGLATTAAPAADDCAQVGGHVYALRGSVLHVAELPAADSETTARAPSSPVFEPMSSPERSPRGLNHSPPRTARPTAKLVGMPTSPSERLRMSSKLIWNEALRIPIPGVGKQSFDHLRVGGRLCVGQDGALLVVGGGVEQDIGQPPVVPLGRHDVDAIRAAAEAAAAAVARDRASLSVTAQVLRVDPSKGLWQRLPNLLEPRRDCVVAKLENGALLVAGGSGTHGALASAEVFHPDQCKWRSVAPMSHARTSASVATLSDGRVAVIGGHKPGRKPHSYRFHSSVEVFDPGSESWTLMDEVMKLPRATCIAGVLGGTCPGSETLLVTGGWAGPFRHTTTEVYDSSMELWRTFPNGEVQGKSLGGSMVYLPESS